MKVGRAVDEGIRWYTPYTRLMRSYTGGILAYTHILMGILTLFLYDYSTGGRVKDRGGGSG